MHTMSRCRCIFPCNLPADVGIAGNSPSYRRLFCPAAMASADQHPGVDFMNEVQI